jgi:hypothetical protein
VLRRAHGFGGVLQSVHCERVFGVRTLWCSDRRQSLLWLGFRHLLEAHAGWVERVGHHSETTVFTRWCWDPEAHSLTEHAR